MLGPILTFDKSFLEMINPQEMDELYLNFWIFVTPTLVSEIIADLKHPAPRDGKLPEEIVMALARKMINGYGVQQMDFRPIGLGDLNQQRIEMNGQVIVDGNAGNVHSLQGGRGIVYDSLPDMEMWHRWSEGDFSKSDELKAQEWRSNIASVDIPAIALYWRNFCAQYLKDARSVDDVIRILDSKIVNSRVRSEQQRFLRIIYELLDAPQAARFMSETLFNVGLLPKIKDWAPYAASVGRLGMAFFSSLSLNFVTSRPTNVIDLQYLFYAPFTMVFVSNDKLHKQLWPATTTKATFVWGEDMKSDLRRYAAAREASTSSPSEEKEPYYRQFTAEDSVIAGVRNRYMRFDPRDVPPPKGKTIADLEPHIQEHFRLADEALERGRREGWKRKDSGDIS